ncbi:predicted protein [Nematostella vectensis]|uniref:G-protein coupled receptors family 1 profile domain-containing protein n=2 Tax=Nematostella vectensis TaxID=45351 RepID=A7RY07_NEMVE|nr:predicted protein [Nematostella vectensis]|eukprot:XP_001635619.1 predicted protein [Nematostella vectensis]
MVSNSEITSWCVVYGIEAFFIVLGNGLAAVVFLTCKSLHRRTYSLLASLAVADFLVGALAAPMFIAVLAQYYGWMSFDKHLGGAQRTIEILTSYASIVTLTMIALERLVAVIAPLRHATESKSSYVSAISLSWVIAILMASLSLLRDYHMAAGKAVFVILMVVMIICMVITCVSYSAIAVLLHKYNQSTFSSSHPERSKRERNLVTTLFIASVVFIVTWLPFQVLNWIFFFEPNSALSGHYIYVSKFLHFLNSLVNPVVYIFRMPEFRQGIREICRCYDETKRNEENAPPIGMDGSHYNPTVTEQGFI